LIEGITFRRETPSLELFKQEYLEQGFLTSPHTLKWFKEEVFFPSQVIDRGNLGEWVKKGKKTAMSRANESIEKIISLKSFNELSFGMKKELFRIVHTDAKKYGFDQELKKRFKNLLK